MTLTGNKGNQKTSSSESKLQYKHFKNEVNVFSCSNSTVFIVFAKVSHLKPIYVFLLDNSTLMYRLFKMFLAETWLHPHFTRLI